MSHIDHLSSFLSVLEAAGFSHLSLDFKGINTFVVYLLFYFVTKWWVKVIWI